MLTEAGKEIARECLLRSGIVDSKEISASLTGFSDLDQNDKLDKTLSTINLSSTEVRHTTSVRKRPVPSSQSTGKKKMNIPSESLDRVLFLF